MKNNYYVLGIDEAGYGPDIGPLVITSSLFRLSEKYHQQKFWKALSEIISKKIDSFPDKIIVSDSKYLFKNYPKNYLIGEITVLCFYYLLHSIPLNFKEFLQYILLNDLVNFQKRCRTFSKWTYKMCWGNINSNNNDYSISDGVNNGNSKRIIKSGDISISNINDNRSNKSYNFFTKYPLNSKNLDPSPFINNLFPKLKRIMKGSGIDLIDIKSIILCPLLYNESIEKGGKLFLNYLQFERLIKSALKSILIEKIPVKIKKETENLEKKYKKVTRNFKKNKKKNSRSSIFIIADKLGSTKNYINYFNKGFIRNFKIKTLEQNRSISSYNISNLKTKVLLQNNVISSYELSKFNAKVLRNNRNISNYRISKDSKLSYDLLNNLDKILENLEMKISFIKEGDKTHFPIAFSSIFSKYIRERFIKNINMFFTDKISNLKVTKGYAYKLEEFIKVTERARKKYNININCFLRKRDGLLKLFD
ncbi:hypothetical protein ES703_78318 [subsurface metagenome]